MRGSQGLSHIFILSFTHSRNTKYVCTMYVIRTRRHSPLWKDLVTTWYGSLSSPFPLISYALPILPPSFSLPALPASSHVSLTHSFPTIHSNFYCGFQTHQTFTQRPGTRPCALHISFNLLNMKVCRDKRKTEAQRGYRWQSGT